MSPRDYHCPLQPGCPREPGFVRVASPSFLLRRSPGPCPGHSFDMNTRSVASPHCYPCLPFHPTQTPAASGLRYPSGRKRTPVPMFTHPPRPQGTYLSSLENTPVRFTYQGEPEFLPLRVSGSLLVGTPISGSNSVGVPHTWFVVTH